MFPITAGVTSCKDCFKLQCKISDEAFIESLQVAMEIMLFCHPRSGGYSYSAMNPAQTKQPLEKGGIIE